MIRHYKCLECNKSGGFHILDFKDRNKARTARLKCRRCDSFNICMINELTGEILQINGEIDAIYNLNNIPAMTEKQRRLETFLVKNRWIISQLVDVMDELKSLSDYMSISDILPEELKEEVKKELKNNKERVISVFSDLQKIENMIEK